MPPTDPWPPSTGVFATYPLQCHCGAIQYTMNLSPPLLESESAGKGIYTALECDCTHCERKGIIACHPKLADVNFTRGLEHRGEYYYAAKKNPHWLCKLCGSTLGTDLTWISENVLHSEPRCTINLRMLRDIRPSALQTRHEGFMRTQ